MQMNQGAEIQCAYCGVAYPELKEECPECQGAGGRFKQAQMMDKESSSRQVLDQLLELFQFEHDLREKDDRDLAITYRRALLNMIENIDLYQFDIKDALAIRLKDLDYQHEIDPKKGLWQ